MFQPFIHRRLPRISTSNWECEGTISSSFKRNKTPILVSTRLLVWASISRIFATQPILVCLLPLSNSIRSGKGRAGRQAILWCPYLLRWKLGQDRNSAGSSHTGKVSESLMMLSGRRRMMLPIVCGSTRMHSLVSGRKWITSRIYFFDGGSGMGKGTQVHHRPSWGNNKYIEKFFSGCWRLVSFPITPLRTSHREFDIHFTGANESHRTLSRLRCRLQSWQGIG